jgi:hypothetical protein
MYEVAEPESLDDRLLILTYPKLKSDLTYIENASDQEKRDAFRDVVQKLADISFDFQMYIDGRKVPDPGLRAMIEMIQQNVENRHFLMSKFVGGFMKRTHRLAHDSELEKDSLVKQMQKAYKPVAKMIDGIPKFPIHGDLFVGNVLVDRRGNLKLHDFRFSLAPLQNDLFDLLNTVGLDEQAKSDELDAAYKILHSKARERGLRLFSHDQFLKDYALVTIARGLKKAVLLYGFEKEAKTPEEQEKHRVGKNQYFSMVLQSMERLRL